MKKLCWCIEPHPYNSDYDSCIVFISENTPEESHREALQMAMDALENTFDDAAGEDIDFTIRVRQTMLDPEDVGGDV